MRLPGTRYQEHGWEHVRKLLGQCSLHACAGDLPERLVTGDGDCFDDYLERCAAALRAVSRQSRAAADGNSYGESVLELALGLLFELQARSADWQAFNTALAAEYARLGPFWRQTGGDAILRKKFNDMFAVLRDKVDADNYVVACGRPCSANRIYAYRMLDTAYADIARLFDNWRQAPEQVGAILGRTVEAAAAPIEVRQMKSIADCRAEWILAWSASRERFTGAAGPLHTRSKRFASLKTSVDKIGEMLAEIGDYESLSANHDGEWQQDAADANAWLDDLARVLDAPPNEEAGDVDRILAPPPRDEACEADVSPDGEPAEAPGASLRAVAVSLPPRYLSLASQAQDAHSRTAGALAAYSMPVRLAVYLKLMGARDDSYPSEWLDPATGELPTMQQLAGLDQVSLPTLRKRRDAAIVDLLALGLNQ